MTNRTLSFFALMLLGLSSYAFAGPIVVKHGDFRAIQVRQSDVLDIVFEVSQLSEDPLGELFDATFESDAGESMELYGFYDGGNRYIVRFCPPSAGFWHYETVADSPELDGQKGLVDAKARGANRPGRIQISDENERRLEYADGSSYYPILFEADWLFALDAENVNDIPRTRDFLKHLRKNGFNQVIMNVYAHDVKWEKDAGLPEKYEFGNPSWYPFGGDNETPNFSELNVEYFRRLDRVIAELDDQGIAAHLMIYVWNKLVNWPEADSEADNRYFEYVVKRYQAYPNIIWDISKEALGYGHDDVDFITRRIERLRYMDAYGSLVTVHDYGYCAKYPELVDVISIQTWKTELYGEMFELYRKFSDKPVLNIEHGGYEAGPYFVFTGDYLSAEACLDRAYQCVFAGTYPTHYWQDSSWNVFIYDPWNLKEVDQPKFHYYRHMASLIDRFGVSGLVPDENRSNAGFCLSNKKDLYLVYGGSDNSRLHVKLPQGVKGMLHSTWFDPYTGDYLKGPSKRIEKYQSYEVPQEGQPWILIVELESDSI